MKEMKRVNIGLPEKVHMQAKVLAVLQGKSLNDYFRDAIADALSTEQKTFARLDTEFGSESAKLKNKDEQKI